MPVAPVRITCMLLLGMGLGYCRGYWEALCSIERTSERYIAHLPLKLPSCSSQSTPVRNGGRRLTRRTRHGSIAAGRVAISSRAQPLYATMIGMMSSISAQERGDMVMVWNTIIVPIVPV